MASELRAVIFCHGEDRLAVLRASALTRGPPAQVLLIWKSMQQLFRVGTNFCSIDEMSGLHCDRQLQKPNPSSRSHAGTAVSRRSSSITVLSSFRPGPTKFLLDQSYERLTHSDPTTSTAPCSA